MEKVEVKFKVSYFYDGREPKPFVAKVTLLIPKKDKLNIHESLVSPNTSVFNNYLVPSWGENFNDYYRGKSIWLYDNSWEGVKGKVQQLIDETIEQLRSVKGKYDEAIRTKPDDETLVVLL